MTEISDAGSENTDLRRAGSAMSARVARDWFVREILPLETILVQFLRRNRIDPSEIPDLRQEVYARIFEAACKQIPESPRAFLLITARNLLIDRVRREQVVPIEAVADLEFLDIASNDAGPERAAIARDALRRLQAAIDHLPRRARQAVVLSKVEGLTRREIAGRMGIAEDTVRQHLMHGMRILADVFHGRDGARENNP